MLGMQSQNWHEKSTHSRGYADNDNVQFERWCLLWARECRRVLTPGGYLIAFGGTRSWHRVACAVEDAGFEIRDSLAWLYATGFPKSLDIAANVAKTVRQGEGVDQANMELSTDPPDWAGWGTALKPAHEPIVLARKPFNGTVAANVLAHGTGGLNIGANRIGPTTAQKGGVDGTKWPSNALLDEAQAANLDSNMNHLSSRYFWVAKPTQAERVHVGGVSHPTVKPLELMRRLVRLVTPPGGVVLEPFAGSGTTVEACILEGFSVIAIEKESIYLPLIKQRIHRRLDPVAAVESAGSDLGLFALLEESD